MDKKSTKRVTLRSITMAALCLLVLLGATEAAAQNQSRTISGKVIDEMAQPIIGATIIVPGTSVATLSDIDGNYQINVPVSNSTIEFRFAGYRDYVATVGTQTTINVTMEPMAVDVDNVVVIGYGTQRKNDLTGTVDVISTKDFNKGLISSADQLINGKVAGVQILAGDGSPTSGSQIRIRGGASLNASNEPLIVVDGVPIETSGIAGNSSNFLSMINVNDIESMTILKDASSTAIYGSRASNGVVIITTKKSAKNRPLSFSFNTIQSIQTPTQSADMLSAEQFRSLVQEKGSTIQQSLLGNTYTNWGDVTFRNAYGTENNLSLAGSIGKVVPFRVSGGYFNQNGILRTDKSERITANLSLTPSFFDDHLKVNVSGKWALNNNTFADGSAVWASAVYNPTIPVYSGNSAFGGYTEAITPEGIPVTRAVLNPLGILEQRVSKSTVQRVIANADVDYKLHFFPDLRVHGTVGIDYATGQGTVYIPVEAASNYTSGGMDYGYGPQILDNRLLTLYLNYNKTVESIKSTFDFTAGYDYQNWKSTMGAYDILNVAGNVLWNTPASDQRHTLLSFYGRFNYSYDSRYLLTATIRRDGTSRFNSDNRWGWFPSVALAWRISQESFLRDSEVLSDLKLRLSYGVTGQQDGIGNYGYLPIYTYGQNGAQYLFGDKYYNTYRPEAYDSNLRWETTTSYNVGLDFGFINNRISGSIDYYQRYTRDLLASVPAPAGSNFDKNIMTNVGNVESKGVEFAINARAIETRDWQWNVGFNFTWQDVKIQNLTLFDGGTSPNTLAGPSVDGQQIQVFTEGYTPYSFYVYKQLYDSNGRPIEGAYADLNNDGVLNEQDLYHYKSPLPDFIFGFNTSLSYKGWTLSTVLRANVGNYLYNGMAMNTGAFGTMSYNDYQLNNLSTSYLATGFQSRQHRSDYYVENASFLKMDNATLAYDFGQIANKVGLRLSFMVQNVFTLTKYTGVDPEIPNGLDSSFYPRPRIYSINLGINF